MTLNVGVLLLGSLYWDGQTHRRKWRQDELEMDRELIVSAPIRYGRKSNSRGNTYTMVFSRSSPLGRAKVVPLKKAVTKIGDLLDAATGLWRAERPANSKTKPNQTLSADWGCVALLPSPRLLKNSGNEITTLLESWAQYVSSEPEYGGTEYSAVDGSVLSQAGILNISWPTSPDTGDPVISDLLLATVTKPNLDPDTREYPSVRKMVEAWKQDKEGNVCYFWNNRKNGIQTFQDEEIVQLLRS